MKLAPSASTGDYLKFGLKFGEHEVPRNAFKIFLLVGMMIVVSNHRYMNHKSPLP